MTCEFVVRLLDEADQLLGWTKVVASPQREEGGRASCPFRVHGLTQFLIEQSGRATKLSVHWVDLDVARLRDLDAVVDVTAGQVMTFTWIEPIWLVSGMRDVPLPSVTVRNHVTLAPPPAAMGARDPRVCA